MKGRWCGSAGIASIVLLTAAPSAFASGWKVVPTPNPSATQNALAAVTRVPGSNTFWAGGWTNNANDVTNGLIERWNGSSWAQVPVPFAKEESIYGIAALDSTHALAVGITGVSSDPLALAWNGSTWSRQTVPLPSVALNGMLNAVREFSATDATAVGIWNSSTARGGLVEQWNGTAWKQTTVPAPSSGCLPYLAGVAGVPATTNRFAVGYCGGKPLIEERVSGVWHVVPLSAPASGALSAITPVSSNDIWAVGSSGSGSHRKTLALHWNGSSWSTVATPNITTPDMLESVVRVPGSQVLWATGSTPGGGAIAMEYTGTWNLVTPVDPGIGTNLAGVAASPTEVWAVGGYVDTSGNAETLAEERAN